MMRSTMYLNVLRQRRERSLRVDRLTKIYPGGTRALDDVCLAFASGLCAVIGPENAGKSTLLRILSWNEVPDRGDVHYDGIDGRIHPDRLRAAMGTVASVPSVPATVPILVAMEHFATRCGWTEGRMRLAWVEAKLRQVGLWEMRGLRAGELPIALQRRFSLAVTLLTSPSVLLLDDPLESLAIEDAVALLALLSELAELRLVVFTTDDAGALGDAVTHMAVLHHGRVLRDGTVDRMVDDLAGRIWSGTLPVEQVPPLASRHVLLGQTREISASAAASVVVVADESPSPDFVLVEPELSHVYQHSIALGARR